MKRRSFLPPVLFLLCSLLVIAAAATGGDASDPLVSLSHLQGAFLQTAESRLDSALAESDQALRAYADGQPFSDSSIILVSADTWQERRLKNGDALSGGTGLNILLLAGEAKVTFPSGAVVDVTEGKEIPSGTALARGHRYLVAEDTAAAFSVTSRTAVLNYQGSGSFTLSDAVDYNAMASALKTMHLFRGSFTGYGQGFDLEMAPTRIQALIMFLRVLGEEEAALAYTGPQLPFTDIRAGSDSAKYVGYAYAKGYTNGFTATLWKPSQTVSLAQYTEFLLRALGYSSVENTNLSDTLVRAVAAGVINSGEAAALSKVSFLRAELVYLSFRSLDATVSGTMDTLSDTLIAKGVFTSAEAREGRSLVSAKRLG